MDFALLCTYLEKLESHSSSTGRRGNSLQLLHGLLEDVRSHGDLYAVVRLLIPKRDGERQHYNLKENSLAIVLVHALSLGANSKDGILLRNWKRTSKLDAGDFIGLAMQVVSRRQISTVAKLSVANINTLLDSLAKSSKRKAQVDLVREVLRKATIVEFKWFLRILFKDLKIGLGENTILDVLHEDARAMMATCIDLKHVCSEVHKRDSQPFRKELILGKVLKSQHCKRMNSVEAAWLAMKRSDIVAECKFDGDRMQIHRDGPKIWFWSRNGKEHPEYTVALQDALSCCLLSERCVLDGELLVWDIEDSQFKARTKNLNHDAARAARKGLNTSHRVCYVIFDVLYEEKLGSLIHLPLKKRREVLRQVVYPDRSPQIFSTVAAEGSEWAVAASSLEELKRFFWQMVERGNEGIVVKRLDSQWTPDNRDGRWSKIKPDYVCMGSDLDLLVIGGYYGSGSRGGKIASFLLALVDHCTDTTRFVSICRCGHGLSEEEFSLLESKLSPYFLLNKKGGRPPPTCGYLVTNSHYECPDVWILKPEMSIVLQISSEKRIYPTQSFKAGWTFRFPRIVKVRYDKCWKDALGVQEFQDIVRAAKEHGNSLLHGSKGYTELHQPRKMEKCLQAKKHQAVLPHLQNLDLSHIEKVDSFFENLIFYICSPENFKEKEALQIQIKSCGGKTMPHFLQCVTHIVASEMKGFYFKVAAENDRDILCLSWVSECIKAKALLPLCPRHYLFQSPTTRRKLQTVLDIYGDPWFANVDTLDLQKILTGMNGKHSPFTEQELRHQMKKGKLSKDWCWDLFKGCCFYFHKPLHSVNPDSQTLAIMTLNRLRLATEMLGASTSSDIAMSTTHVLVYIPPKSTNSLASLLQSLKRFNKVQLELPHINIVGHSWLEDCLNKKKRLCINSHLLSRDRVHKLNEIKSVKRQVTNSKHSSPPVREIQSAPALEENSENEDRKRQYENFVKSPCCSLRVPSLEPQDLGTFLDVHTSEDKIEKAFSCIQEPTEFSALPSNFNLCNDSAELAKSQSDTKLSMSKIIWESQSLQHIAQLYLGSYCHKFPCSSVDYLSKTYP